jgi:predicted phosphoribosyltransferase
MFTDRADAGRRLAEHLARALPERGDAVVVLGIPRGGVVVAAPVARALEAPLDVIVPRKLGAPGNPELAVGALALADGQEIVVLDQATVAWLGVKPAYLEAEVARQRLEIQRREAAYRAGRTPAPIAGRIALLVDDGIATGMTARAAAKAIASRGPREVVVAAPVAPPDAVAEFRDLGLRLIALETPTPFRAVGRFYERFESVEDDEVQEALARGTLPRPS